MKLSISLLLSLIFAVAVFTQNKEVTAEADLPLTGDATTTLRVPDYPRIAKDAGLRGRVTVDVTLDHEGRVVSADNVKGPYPVCQSVTEPPVLALRDAALTAALDARLQHRDGQSTDGMKGRITYYFGADPEPVSAKPGEMRLDRITKLGSADTGARVADSGQGVIKDSTDSKEIRLDKATRLGSTDTGARVIRPGETAAKIVSDPSTLPKMVSGGVLNGKAESLPKPSYPPAAKAVRASGAVSVQVLILEDGSVYSGAAISGHPLLRGASEIAACESRFLPTVLSGHPVKVSGVITYNFVP